MSLQAIANQDQEHERGETFPSSLGIMKVICWWPSPAQSFLVCGPMTIYLLIPKPLISFEMGPPLRRKEGIWLLLSTTALWESVNLWRNIWARPDNPPACCCSLTPTEICNCPIAHLLAGKRGGAAWDLSRHPQLSFILKCFLKGQWHSE
jgi:hypothetical protein